MTSMIVTTGFKKRNGNEQNERLTHMAHKITLEQLHMIISGSFIRDEDDCDTWHDLELDVAKSLELGDMTKDDDPRVGQEIVEKLNEISKLMHELDVKFHDAYDCR